MIPSLGRVVGRVVTMAVDRAGDPCFEIDDAETARRVAKLDPPADKDDDDGHDDAFLNVAGSDYKPGA